MIGNEVVVSYWPPRPLFLGFRANILKIWNIDTAGGDSDATILPSLIVYHYRCHLHILKEGQTEGLTSSVIGICNCSSGSKTRPLCVNYSFVFNKSQPIRSASGTIGNSKDPRCKKVNKNHQIHIVALLKGQNKNKRNLLVTAEEKEELPWLEGMKSVVHEQYVAYETVRQNQ